MIFKSFVAFFVLYNLGAECREYTYDHLAGGWLKLHLAASWEMAQLQCDMEGAVLASPVNSQVRDAIKNYLKREGYASATILTGIQANKKTGDWYSVENISLNDMPVLVETAASVDYKSGKICINWSTAKDEVAVRKCSDQKPYVCFQKRKSLKIAGCGTLEHDRDYSYDYRSGSCYKFHRKGQTWMKAFKQCQNEGGHLAVINSALEHKVLLEVFAKNPSGTITISELASPEYAFIGFRYVEEDKQWETVVGAESLADAGYDVWAAGEPSNGHGNEYCGSLYRPGHLNDADCGYEYAFICEKSPQILYT